MAKQAKSKPASQKDETLNLRKRLSYLNQRIPEVRAEFESLKNERDAVKLKLSVN